MSEQKSKLTLIVDGNWLLISRMSNMVGRFATEKDMMRETKLLMIKSINKVLRQFPKIDNIIFVADGGSWRGKEAIPSCLIDDSNSNIIESADYKGTRTQDDSIDWGTVFSEYEKFLDTLNYCGLQVCREQDVEGDDWCWYWSTKLNSEGTNVIIWSKDRDLTQLVNKNQDGFFTVWWNMDNGVIIKEVSEEDDFASFFMNPYYASNEQLMHDIISHSTTSEAINPNIVRIEKIFRGDKGDNIFPIIQRRSKSGGNKLFRISTKDMDYDLDIYNDNEIKKYITRIFESKNYKDRTLHSLEDTINHYFYNRKLVCLHENEYPEYIKKIFGKYSTYKFSKNTEEAEQQIQAEKNSLNDLLDSL